MGEKIKIARRDGSEFGAYCSPARTESSLGNVIVLQEIFGVNNHVRVLCDEFAAEGYHAVAPALFDRLVPNLELAYDEAGRARGIELMQSLSLDDVVSDVEATLHALPRAKTAVVGYCWGGTVAWASAAHLGEHLACSVSYYGGGIANLLELDPACPVLCHFGTQDHSIPLADVARLREAHPELAIHTYVAGHAFANVDRPSYHKGSSDEAQERTIKFLLQNMTIA